MKYLLKINADYRDDFGVEGFEVLTVDEYKMYQFVIDNQDKYNDCICIGFGSNQELFYDGLSDLLKDIRVQEISNNDSRVLEGYFGGSYGLVYPFEIIKDIAKELGYKKQPIIKEPVLYKIMNTNSYIEWLVNATKDDIINYAKHKDISNRDKITKLSQAIEVIEEYPHTIVIRQHDYLNDTKTAMIMGNHLNEFVNLHEYLLKHDYWYKEEMLDK